MEFVIAFGFLATVLVGLLVLGARDPRPISAITGAADQRRWATQAEVEGGDIDLMLKAQNDSRRRRGKRELSREEVERQATEDQSASLDRAHRSGTA